MRFDKQIAACDHDPTYDTVAHFDTFPTWCTECREAKVEADFNSWQHDSYVYDYLDVAVRTG